MYSWSWHLDAVLTANRGPEVDLTEENGLTYATVKGYATIRSGFTDNVHVALYDSAGVYLCRADYDRIDDNLHGMDYAVPQTENGGEYYRRPFDRACNDHLFQRYETVRLWISWTAGPVHDAPPFSGFRPAPYPHH
jgi:hypothetical protein